MPRRNEHPLLTGYIWYNLSNKITVFDYFFLTKSLPWCFSYIHRNFKILFNFSHNLYTERQSNMRCLMSSFSHRQNSHFASDLDLHLYLKELHFKILFTTYNKIHLSILSNIFFTLLSYISFQYSLSISNNLFIAYW